MHTTPLEDVSNTRGPYARTPLRNAGTKCPGAPPRSQSGSRISRFVFTLNNYTEDEYNFLKDWAPTTKWFIMGKEVGENGTPHLQGACIIGSQWSFSKLKTLTGFNRAHIEVMRGTPSDSRTYCSKEDSSAFEVGELPTQGKRNDIHNAVIRIRGGENLRQLASDENGGVAVVKFYKGLTTLRSLLRPPRNSPPVVIWLYGPTGSGKTRCAMECARRINTDSNVPGCDIWLSSGDLRWFDGYDGQQCVVLDDFRAKLVKFCFFLRLLDRYPVRVEFKGGFVEWEPRFIFITCPYSPDECFSTRKEHVPEDIAQLSRRISYVFEFEPCDSAEALDRACADFCDTNARLFIARAQEGLGAQRDEGQVQEGS